MHTSLNMNLSSARTQGSAGTGLASCRFAALTFIVVGVFICTFTAFHDMGGIDPREIREKRKMEIIILRSTDIPCESSSLCAV
jgi:hypothetical protein